jgi:rhodanese-related sulfurtransferase
MDLNIIQMLEFINQRLKNIERNIARLEDKIDFSVALQRNHLIRVKNNQFIDDSMILYGRPYNDLSPTKAWEIYQNPNMDFIILDVCEKGFQRPYSFEEGMQMPFTELPKDYEKIPSKSIPILVISEDGTSSILACEYLVKKGHFNVNNVSGGYKYWPGNQAHQLKEMSKSA